MPMQAPCIAEERRRSLGFSGNLSVSASQDSCVVRKPPSPSLKSCIIGLWGINRLFDSGTTLSKMLHRHLVKHDVRVVSLRIIPAAREGTAASKHQALACFQ